MSYASDDAETFSAREILYLCRGKLLGEVRQEKSCDRPDVGAWRIWKACLTSCVKIPAPSVAVTML